MHDKPHTLLTVVDEMTVHSLVLYGVAIMCRTLRSFDFTTGEIYSPGHKHATFVYP